MAAIKKFSLLTTSPPSLGSFFSSAVVTTAAATAAAAATTSSSVRPSSSWRTKNSVLFIVLFQILLFLVLQCPGVQSSTQLPDSIQIGVILEAEDEYLEQTLLNAVEKFNNHKIVLPRTKITYSLHFVGPQESFKAARVICQMINKRVWALVSMTREPTHSFVRSLANDLQIPHLALSWDYHSSYLDNINHPPKSVATGQTGFGGVGGSFGASSLSSSAGSSQARMTGSRQTAKRRKNEFDTRSDSARLMMHNPSSRQRYNAFGPAPPFDGRYAGGSFDPRLSVPDEDHYSISLYPDSNQLSWAFRDLVRSRNWKSLTIIYDNTDGLIMLKDLIQIASHKQNLHVKVNVMEFPRQDKVAVVSRDGPLGDHRDFSGTSSQSAQYQQHPPGNWSTNSAPHHWLQAHKQQLERTFKNNYEEMINLAGNRNAQIDVREEYLYRKLLKDLKKTEHNFVLALNPQRTIKVLEHAYNAKRMSEYDNFLIASLDFHRLDLAEFRHKTLANITGFSLLSSQSIDELDLGDLRFGLSSYRIGSRSGNSGFQPSHTSTQRRPSPRHSRTFPMSSARVAPDSEFHIERVHSFTTKEALIYDAIMLLAHSLDDLDRSIPEVIAEPVVSCKDPKKQWPFGAHFVSYMKQLKLPGLTGMLHFDSNGQRVNFTLDLLQVKQDGLKNVATWNLDKGIKSAANYTFYDSYKQVLEAMKYKEFKVTVPSTEVKPYIYLKENHTELVGNDKFDGFCVDLLKKVQQVFQQEFGSDFKYQIRFVADGKYGRPNKQTGEWDGMLGELMRHQSDLAIADLTATYLRETAVDFTMPFMNLGIAILFKKTAEPDPELFSFLKPLSVPVWLYLASAFLGISMFFWMLSRLSPYEWVSPHSCDPEPLELENQFSIGNSLWFSIGSLMQQGSDIAPRALSTRALASVWWFFTLIMISSYTANLAASLTLSRMAPAISNVEDLAKQTVIQYGCKKGGSTYEFFQNSNHTTYQRMFNTMESNPEVYINKVDDAIERVRKGGYAYLAESSTIEYLVQRKCDLYQVGTWLDNKGYGIATPTDSPYRTPISNAIVVLQDRGELYELKKKWWIEKGGGLCADEAKVASASELNIENLGGVFVVLVGGVGLGCLFGALEFIWKSLKIARDERESIYKLIWLEIVRICTGGGSSRPVYQAQSSANLANISGNNNNNLYGPDGSIPDQQKISRSMTNLNATLLPPPPSPQPMAPSNMGVNLPLGTPLGSAILPPPLPAAYSYPGVQPLYSGVNPSQAYPFVESPMLGPGGGGGNVLLTPPHPRASRSQINSPSTGMRPAKSPTSASAYNGMY